MLTLVHPVSLHDPRLPDLALALELTELEAAVLLAEGVTGIPRRTLLPHETASRVGFAEIAVQLDALTVQLATIALGTRAHTLAGLLTQLRATSRTNAQVVQALAQLQMTGPASLPGVTDAVREAAARIANGLEQAAAHFGGNVGAEALRQGVPPPLVRRVAPSPATIAAVRATAARVATAPVVQVLGAAAATASSAPSSGTVAALLAAIAAGADGLSDAGVTDLAHQGANEANGMGRGDGLGGVDAPFSAYASELNDSNTCGPCDAVDGTDYDNLDDALGDYPDGQYVGCEGGGRCRGMLVYVFDTEAEPGLG